MQIQKPREPKSYKDLRRDILKNVAAIADNIDCGLKHIAKVLLKMTPSVLDKESREELIERFDRELIYSRFIPMEDVTMDRFLGQIVDKWKEVNPPGAEDTFEQACFNIAEHILDWSGSIYDWARDEYHEHAGILDDVWSSTVTRYRYVHSKARYDKQQEEIKSRLSVDSSSAKPSTAYKRQNLAEKRRREELL